MPKDHGDKEIKIKNTLKSLARGKGVHEKKKSTKLFHTVVSDLCTFLKVEDK